MNYIPRTITPIIERAARYFPVIVVSGPRQSGKSTLCNHIFREYKKYNLEDLGLREYVRKDMKGFISDCGDKVVIDEAQRLPDLLSYIQISVDENPERSIVLTGSSNFALMESVTQSLAGRAINFTLLPLTLEETGTWAQQPINQLLYQGLYPSVVTDARPADLFYPSYVTTYVERDVRQIKNISDLSLFQDFMRMLAARAGTEFNASALSVELGISSPTVKAWLSVLEASYIVFRLTPYYANINKRLTKSPKIYFYDTGLLCYLLGITDCESLRFNPARGGIFENLAVLEVMKGSFNLGKQPLLHYYRENSGKEVDLLLTRGSQLDLLEVKASQTYNPSFESNLTHLRQLLGDKVADSAIVYDGTTIPPHLLNIRDLASSLK